MTLFLDNRPLLKKFKVGSESALRETYHFYFRAVEQFISTGWFDPITKRRVGRIADFELQAELIQEVFLRAFSDNARSSYDGIRPYKKYLLQIARNVTADHFRKRLRDAAAHANMSFDDSGLNLEAVVFSEYPESDEISEEDILDWNRCVREAAAFIESLEPLRQEFIKLRFQGELSILETARQLKLTRGKARQVEKELGRSLRRHFQTLNVNMDFIKSVG